MAVTVLFAGVPVSDHRVAFAFYERLLGRPPDLLAHEREALWQIGEAGWIYVVADAGRAGKGLLTLIVDDLDDLIAGLDARGLAAGAIETLSGGQRKATIADPDGNMVSFAEVPGG